MKRALKFIAPVVIVTLAVMGAFAIVSSRPAAKTVRRDPPAPLVRARTVHARDLTLTVRTQGTVTPAIEIDVVAEVSGRVSEVSEALQPGAFFREGEVLLAIDAREFELAVARTSAAVAEARVRVARERAEADVAIREWNELYGGKPPPLVAREPQLAEAKARLQAAQADLERAELDLTRTKVVAPFTGRVRDENIDVGGFVARGNRVARIYSVGVAELRLPIPDDQLAFLDLPLGFAAQDAGANELPKVKLSAMFAGKRHEWSGAIVRTEGELDPESRMVHAIARVDDPYGVDGTPRALPLSVGMFVDAEIAGRRIQSGYDLPRSALRSDNRVWVIDTEDLLTARDVEVVRLEADRVIISAGLADGERVCESALEIAVEGMPVRAVDVESEDRNDAPPALPAAADPPSERGRS